MQEQLMAVDEVDFPGSVKLTAMTPLDTSSAASEIQIKILRKMTCGQRLKLAIEFSELTRKLAFARIEREHPGISKPELVRKFLDCVLGSGSPRPR
jgi:hypothetical protein